MEKKTVLACLGERKREVTFTAEGDKMKALTDAIKRVYADKLQIDGELVIQLKDENWGGEFVDASTTTIPDRGVVKVIDVNEVEGVGGRRMISFKSASAGRFAK